MNNGGRIHSMDALRASTMLLLVPVHAATVLSLNGRGGTWAGALFWLVHVFRLPLFFAMSGFFLTLLITRKGLLQTAQNRTLRIVVPLALGLLTVVPLMFLASQATGTIVASDGRLTSGSPLTFNPAFLWFLWYLLILDGLAIALYLLAPALLSRAGTVMRAAVAHPLAGIALLAVPTTVALWPSPDWTASPAADSWAPDLPVLAYYALFFGLGATLSAHRNLVSTVGRDAWRWAACALAAGILAAALFTLHDSEHASSPWAHGAALAIYAIASWLSLLALVGLAERYLNRPHPTLRYLADSAYWIYLSHLPALVLIVALLTAARLGTASQFTIAVAGSLAASLATYALFVRYTVIGRVLNGPRQRPKAREVTPPARAAGHLA
jgi:peptidoglycan/LPS O-acetylase OafA/YrhL